MAKTHIPFFERLGCSVDDAVTAAGIGRTKLFSLIADKRLDSTLVDGRRVIVVASLRRLIEGDPALQTEQNGADEEQRTNAD